MKFKFTKLAALLLAGAALLAAGCTDYEVDIQKVDKKVDELAVKTAADLNAQVDALKAMINTLEANYKAADQALKTEIEQKINAINTQISDLQNTKLDKSTFETYKTETAQTIQLLNDAIDAIKANYATKVELQEAVAGVEAKLNDYVLKTTFNEFVAIAATKTDVEKAKTELEGKIAAAKTELEGKIGEAKAELEAKIEDLQGQIDVLDGKLAALDGRVETLETTVADIVEELAFAEGDLKGYIDDAAAAALEQAIAYVDAAIADLKDALMYYIVDLYNLVYANLQRIQSVVFVPTHDDLKMNMNVSIITQDAVDEETGETEKVAFYYGQPTEVTYKITPTEYAEWLAYYVDWALDKELSQLYKEYLDYSIPAVYFDVKSLETRADEEEATPELAILGVTKVDNTTGEITFLVEPYDIASPEFLANANQPLDYMELYTVGEDGETSYLMAGSLEGDYEDEAYINGNGIMGELFDLFGVESYTIPVWRYADLAAYKTRKAFAASLNIYCPDADNYGLYMDGYAGGTGELEMDDYFLFHNELASTYSVLYPISMTMDILPEPYKPELDENGDPKVDEDGYAYLVKAMEEHQELPYSSLRENPVGEKASQDPKGYRVILDGAVPAISVNGDRPMTLEDASDKYLLYYPIFDTTFDGFTYDQNTAAEPVDEENFVETEKVYAEIEMNPAKTAAERKDAIGDLITGTYSFTSFLGSFKGWGDVLITPALGEVAVDATIVWTYAEDADVDHNLFYETGEEPQIYSRKAYPINVNAEDLKYLSDNLDVDLDSFADAVPTSFTVSYVDKETGETVEVEYDPKAGVPAEGEGVEISGVAITEDGLVADIINFEWDQTYTLVAIYELPDATITVNGTITTIDRNREKVVLGPFEHTFIINGDEFVDGYYKWESALVDGKIFEAFDKEGVINVGDNVDFAYDAAQEEFNEAELIEKLETAKEPGTAWDYIYINEGPIFAHTLEHFTPSVLAGEVFNSGKRSADDPNLWLGNDVTRNINTYIGEEVEFHFVFNYKVPDYNFLHLRYYTFNKDKEVAEFIQQRDFADNDGSVLWWTQVNPSYFTTVAEEGTSEDDAQLRVSNRYALADYDVAYINLAELAFNVVDEKDEIIEDAQLEELGLNVEFIYTDPEQGEKELPEVDQIDPEFLLYESLWVDNTVFYYRTNEKKFIPALGQLTLTSGDYDFPVATRFEFPKAAVNFPEEVLDYSTYAMVRWTPFKAPVAKGFTIVLDENKVYREPLFKGMELMDNRPNGVSFYVIKDGEWVVGDAAESATASSKSNGYISGIAANDAYHITTDFVYDTTGIPSELKKLLSIEVENGVPYVVYDYTSEVTFHGVITIPVVVKLENPWQETLKFVYDVTIKGYGD